MDVENSRSADDLLCGMPAEPRYRSWHLVLPAGEVRSGGLLARSRAAARRSPVSHAGTVGFASRGALVRSARGERIRSGARPAAIGNLRKKLGREGNHEKRFISAGA